MLELSHRVISDAHYSLSNEWEIKTVNSANKTILFCRKFKILLSSWSSIFILLKGRLNLVFKQTSCLRKGCWSLPNISMTPSCCQICLKNNNCSCQNRTTTLLSKEDQRDRFQVCTALHTYSTVDYIVNISFSLPYISSIGLQNCLAYPFKNANK